MSVNKKISFDSKICPQIDLIIVGAGISGLSIGLKVLQKYPKATVVICEKYAYVGGRITTYRKNIPKIGRIQWENGAGRISQKHTELLGLLKLYNLHTITLPSISQYRSTSTNSSCLSIKSLFELYANVLTSLPNKILATHTVKELLPPSISTPLLDRIPYWADTHILRSDLALQTLQEDLGIGGKFYVCAEGLDELIKRMRHDFESRGGIIYERTEVIKVSHDNNQACDIIECIRREPVLSGQIQEKKIQVSLASRVTVLALHVNALKQIFTRSLPKSRQPIFLSRLAMSTLVRIYAIFPTKNGKSWFSDIPTTVLPSPIRYFIPIKSSKGIVMISYSDGPAAAHWIKKMEESGSQAVKLEVMSHIRAMFPEKKNIPEPVYFKIHPWHDGCTYWLPGNYDVIKESVESLYPVPDLLPSTFVCSESTSLRQTWIEGALEQADKLYNISNFWEKVCGVRG